MPTYEPSPNLNSVMTRLFRFNPERHHMKELIRETRDGFQVSQDHFELPSNTVNLDPKTKRVVTICNLFINHRLTVSDISRVLDDNEGAVVSALIRRGLIKDR